MNKKINLTEVAERWLRNEGKPYDPAEIAKLSRFGSLTLQRQDEIFDNVQTITKINFAEEKKK